MARAWAINGLFSVITATLGTMLAMSYAFRAVLLLGLAIYAVGVRAMLRVRGPVRLRADSSAS